MGRRPGRRAPPAAAHRRCTRWPRRRRRAASSTTWCAPASRCSPRTPTPTSRPTASTRRWPARSASSTRRWSSRTGDGTDKIVTFVPHAAGRAGPRRDRPPPVRGGSATTTAHVQHSGRGPVPAGGGRGPGDRPGRRARGRRGGAGRGGAAAGTSYRGRPALLEAHPYEEPAYDVLELANDVGPGHPRARPDRPAGGADHACGSSPSRSARRCRRPRTASGSPATPTGRVETVVVASGSGDFMLDTVLGLDADVYVTSDLRHHRAGEFREHDGAGARRRGALGGRVDLAAGRRGQTGGGARRPRGYGGHPGEHHRDRPVDLPGLTRRTRTLPRSPR